MFLSIEGDLINMDLVMFAEVSKKTYVSYQGGSPIHAPTGVSIHFTDGFIKHYPISMEELHGKLEGLVEVL